MSQYTYQYNNDMEKMKHTPGPWYPSFHAGICIGVQNSPDGFTQMICNSILPETDDMYEKWGEQIEADMKLIAAAPDLLEALEAFVTDIEGHPSVAAREHYGLLMAKAKEAIKKARGL